jgi:hypothetical protein
MFKTKPRVKREDENPLRCKGLTKNDPAIVMAGLNKKPPVKPGAKYNHYGVEIGIMVA